MFYRIDGIAEGDFGNLSAPRFLALTERTLCYAGAVRLSYQVELAEKEHKSEAGQQDLSAPASDDQIAASLRMEPLDGAAEGVPG